MSRAERRTMRNARAGVSVNAERNTAETLTQRTPVVSELPVACYCAAETKRMPQSAIREGTSGWSCGRKRCTSTCG